MVCCYILYCYYRSVSTCSAKVRDNLTGGWAVKKDQAPHSCVVIGPSHVVTPAILQGNAAEDPLKQPNQL